MSEIMFFRTAVLFAPVPWACAALAGLVVFLLLRHPTRPLRRVTVEHTANRRNRGVSRLVVGRPDAASPARRAWVSTLAALAVCLAASRLDGGPGRWAWFGLPVLAFGLTVGLGWLEPSASRRREQQLVLQVPQALELLAACLAAGMPARSACAAVAAAFEDPVAADLGRVMAATALGVSDAEAWRSLRDHPQLGPVAMDLARSVESGTQLVEGLRRHAQVARERRRAAQQVRARSVGVRSVLPLMICFIPSFMLLGVVPTVVSAITHAFVH